MEGDDEKDKSGRRIAESGSGNPRAAWELKDYVRYMETGQEPDPPPLSPSPIEEAPSPDDEIQLVA